MVDLPRKQDELGGPLWTRFVSAQSWKERLFFITIDISLIHKASELLLHSIVYWSLFIIPYFTSVIQLRPGRVSELV